ncbi:MAG: cation diffusion facilitator family transporter [Anaerolineae bacterium]|nr:cation diffusion facilitator family transporter [Anaerolineae bacterium]MDW8101579.1 cation diffusion facilitator family transporter [Anaerolineae bacterium]
MNQAKQRLAWALILTSVILATEVAGGLWTRSLALLSDAAHVFFDILALGFSYLALRLASLPPDDRYTYGFHRVQVLAALVNGATLVLVAFGILREAWERFLHPENILAGPMLVVALIGFGINLLVILILRRHDHHDLNVRSAFLHVLGDTLSSIGVIAAGAIIFFTRWFWVDPLISVFIVLIILAGSGRLLKETVPILIEGMPAGIRASQVAEAMLQVEGVQEVHDLHVWTISPGFVALSAHVVLADQALSQAQSIMEELKHLLTARFGIEHTTIQFECQSCGQGTSVCVVGMSPWSREKGESNHAH